MIAMTRLIPMPQALGEVVFTGRESSIAISQAPSRLAGHDWMIITGQAGDRQVQIAITRKERLPEIWQALAGTGAGRQLDRTCANRHTVRPPSVRDRSLLSERPGASLQLRVLS